ncbi:MAG: hypothetical protein U7M05_12690, partial [Candidatus Igneacidithiobacillus chanchocoensis]
PYGWGSCLGYRDQALSLLMRRGHLVRPLVGSEPWLVIHTSLFILQGVRQIKAKTINKNRIKYLAVFKKHYFMPRAQI